MTVEGIGVYESRLEKNYGSTDKMVTPFVLLSCITAIMGANILDYDIGITSRDVRHGATPAKFFLEIFGAVDGKLLSHDLLNF